MTTRSPAKRNARGDRGVNVRLRRFGIKSRSGIGVGSVGIASRRSGIADRRVGITCRRDKITPRNLVQRRNRHIAAGTLAGKWSSDTR